MIKKSIHDLDFLKIKDEQTGAVYFGCDQEWYSKAWQRMAGCGPTVASTLIYYSRSIREQTGMNNSFENKQSCLKHMEEVWEFVTPTMKGVNSTALFCRGLSAYLKDRGVNADYVYLDVPKNLTVRPSLQAIAEFIDAALQNDSPVAFLNLCNGKEKNLDKWHWVTIVAMEHDEGYSTMFVDVLDEGLVKKIDLRLWYETTTKDGGFVYLR